MLYGLSTLKKEIFLDPLKKVVYLASILEGGRLLSLPQAAEYLGIKKLTLWKWVDTKKARPKKILVGGRHFYGFSKEEIDRLKSLMKPRKNWRTGQRLFKNTAPDSQKGVPKTPSRS